MKLNWFTPLPPARSDIANSVERLLPALQRHAEIVLWTDAREVSRSLARAVEVRRYQADRVDWRALNHADHTLYNVGNDGRFHSAIMGVAHRHPGIVVLHDLSVHELALHTLQQGPAWRERYTELMEREGPDGLEAAVALLEGRTTPDALASAYPLATWAFHGAHGIVVHNGPLFRELCPDVEQPWLDVPLPYLPVERLLPARPRRRDGGRLEIVICGFLNSSNRRLHPVLDALAAFPRRREILLHIAGQVADEKALKERIRALGLGENVRLYGFLREDRLSALLDRMHLAVNLRFPSRGEASGSQLRFWNHSLPTLVSSTGWYGRLPTDCALQVDPANEQADLHRHWAAALDRFDTVSDSGLRGRALLGSTHSAENFAAALMDFLPLVEAFRKRAFAPVLAQRIGAAAAALRLPQPALETVADAAAGQLAALAGTPAG